jgi:hypothetical protein
MMNVRAVEEEIKVRHLLGHDEKHAHPRQDKRQNESEQRPARQPVDCFAVQMVFCVHFVRAFGFSGKPVSSSFVISFVI